MRVDRDERGGRADRRRQHLGDRVARELLQAEVDRGAHAEVAAVHAARPVVPDELVGDVVGEVRRRRALGRRQVDVLRPRQRSAHPAAVLGRVEVALLEHLAEHEVAPGAGQLRMRDRVPEARILGDPGKERRLPRVDVRRVGSVAKAVTPGRAPVAKTAVVAAAVKPGRRRRI